MVLKLLLLSPPFRIFDIVRKVQIERRLDLDIGGLIAEDIDQNLYLNLPSVPELKITSNSAASRVLLSMTLNCTTNSALLLLLTFHKLKITSISPLHNSLVLEVSDATLLALINKHRHVHLKRSIFPFIVLEKYALREIVKVPPIPYFYSS